MKISVKARYGLSAMICLSQNYNNGEFTTIISLADRLKISKIYLEQVFSLLKHAGLVISVKGAQGGYQLARMPKDISAFDLLSSIETSLFNKTESTVSESAQSIEKAIQNMIYDNLDDCVKKVLSNISLEDLMAEVYKQSSNEGYMYHL